MGWPPPNQTLSEDCLTLNVYTGPANASATSTSEIFTFDRLTLIHISAPTRPRLLSYAVLC